MPTSKRRDTSPLTAAMRYYLMAGESPDVRIRGWVALAQQGRFGEPTPDRAWAAHGPALVAEGAAAGFEPYWSTQQAPAGAGFRHWRDAFVREHGY